MQIISENLNVDVQEDDMMNYRIYAGQGFIPINTLEYTYSFEDNNTIRHVGNDDSDMLYRFDGDKLVCINSKYYNDDYTFTKWFDSDSGTNEDGITIYWDEDSGLKSYFDNLK